MQKKLLVITPLFVLFGVVTAWGAKMYPPVEPEPGIYYDKFLWVKFQDDLDIGLSVEGLPTDRSGGGLSGPQGQAVMEYIQSEGGRWERMIAVSEARADEWRSRAAFNGKETADLNTYFHLWVGEEASAQDWLEKLAGLPEVAKLGRVPLPADLPTPPAFDTIQRYLDIVPATDTQISIRAEFAWTKMGGHGENVTVCDVERAWDLEHVDLPESISVWVHPDYCFVNQLSLADHGTGVLGVLGSSGNCFGTLGIARAARLAVSPSWLLQPPNCLDTTIADFRVSAALAAALDSLLPGDVMVIEEQTNLMTLDSMSDSVALAPLEAFWPAYDIIKTAVGYGIHVVEAAGNGGLDLGSFDSDSIFIDTAKYSGAIIVGAGSPGPLLGAYGYEARQRRSDSNYGPSPDTTGRKRRVDVQGWGDLVATTGYDEDSLIYDGEGVHAAYQWFWGTSSATPIVAGAVAILESIYEQCNPGYTMNPEVMRQLLRNTGLPQMGSDSATHPIGPLVNLKNAMDSVLTCATNCCSGKRGNINQDSNNVVDLSDLSLLIDYLDASPCWNELPCPSAVDANGDTYFNNSDLTILVQYLVFNNDQRADCP